MLCNKERNLMGQVRRLRGIWCLLSVLLVSALTLGWMPATAMADDATPPNPQHMWTQGAQEEAGETQPNDSGIQLYSATTWPYWTTNSDGSKAFFDGERTAFANPAMKVIDVSEHQGSINWSQVKASGVDAAIIRVGYGYGNVDKYFAQNLRGATQAGLHVGIYLYSYAYDANFALNEANFVADMANQYGLGNMTLPIFYDLEKWSWTGYTCPSTPAQYTPIVNTFMNQMRNRGYTNVSIYTYRDYANTALNTAAMRSRISWIAEYNPTTIYTFPGYSGGQGWQYTSTERVNGINGNVDMSGFDEYLFKDTNSRSTPHYADVKWLKQTGITTGYTDNTYRGGDVVQRQDMAAFLRRLVSTANKSFNLKAALNFSDVNSATPHYADIEWLSRTGISNGWAMPNGTKEFRPSTGVLRQDMAAFLYRTAGSPAYTPSAADKAKFVDVNDSTPHAKEIWWCASKGITQGWNVNGRTEFRPGNVVIRQDMATFLHSTYNVMK